MEIQYIFKVCTQAGRLPSVVIDTVVSMTCVLNPQLQGHLEFEFSVCFMALPSFYSANVYLHVCLPPSLLYLLRSSCNDLCEILEFSKTGGNVFKAARHEVSNLGNISQKHSFFLRIRTLTTFYMFCRYLPALFSSFHEKAKQ